MVSRVKYCLPIDVIRRVDSSIDQSNIGDNYSISVDPSIIRTHIEGVENKFERRATELTDQSQTEELHEGIERDFGWTVYLDEQNAKPLDTNEGDLVEMRTGRDQNDWTDVTDDTFLDAEQGVIEVDRRFVRQSPVYPEETNYRFRVTYRYGATGDEAGETVTTGTVSDSTTPDFTLGVADAGQIPVGSVILVGADEYMFVTDRDTNNNTLTIGERAIRGTTAVSHSSDEEITFIPLDVRDAIAGQVASRLLRQDDFLDTLNEGAGDSIDTQQKVEDLEAEFESVVGLYQTNSGYV